MHDELQLWKIVCVRRPSRIEICVLGSWLLTGACAALMSFSTVGWLSFLWSLYGNRNWPSATNIYLSSDHWSFLIPLLSGIPIFELWRRNQLDQFAPFILIALHALSIGIFVFMIFAAIEPFWTTTFRMSESS